MQNDYFYVPLMYYYCSPRMLSRLTCIGCCYLDMYVLLEVLVIIVMLERPTCKVKRNKHEKLILMLFICMSTTLVVIPDVTSAGCPLKLHFQIPCVFPVRPQVFPEPVHLICDYYIHKTELADLSSLTRNQEIFGQKLADYAVDGL